MKKIDIDQMMTVQQAAEWLQMSVETLRAKSHGPKAAIPGFYNNQRQVRYHPRTIIAVQAARAGVSPDIIQASMGIGGSK